MLLNVSRLAFVCAPTTSSLLLRSSFSTCSPSSMAAVKNVSIDITSDTICPWCWFAYRHVQQAIKQTKDEKLPLEFDIKFHPFELDSNLPPSPGYVKRDWYARRLGPAGIPGAEEQMLAHGRSEGIELCYDGQISSTFNSHRLLEKARQVGGQQAHLKLVEALFKGYHTQAEDIGNSNMLANHAAGTGVMTKSEALDFLASDELKPQVKEGIMRARMKSISGVPYIVINDKYVLTGARGPGSFYKIFSDIARS